MPINNPALSEREEKIAEAIVHAAFAMHKTLGPGLLEGVYEVCLCHELTKRGLDWEQQVRLPLVYDGVRIDEGLRLDFS
jgi:GxxExxY protein